MSVRDLTWSKTEKKIARAAFDNAYRREMQEIKEKVQKKVQNFKEDQDVWELYNYLRARRKDMGGKYDYRYSVLIYVFGRLLREGYVTEEELQGLSEEKITYIKRLVEF